VGSRAADLARRGVKAVHRRLPAGLRDKTGRVWHAVHPPDPAVEHEAFLRSAYRRLLDRDVDEVGLRSNLWRMANGVAAADVVMEIAESPEYASRVIEGRVINVPGHAGIADLTELRPESYQLSVDAAHRRMLTFVAKSGEDFDWLERQIILNDYYERPGVWILEIDLDKRVMAEVVRLLEPASVLELGCSSGAVITCLVELGVDAEGVDISESSRALAPAETQTRIHVGDLLEMQLERRYDVVMGLDVFEHLNPNKLDAYLAALVERLDDGGFVFANIPAYGEDPVFGVVNPVLLPEWTDTAAGLFSLLPVDDAGYPLHGHLVWATTQWWTSRFSALGLRRETEIERAIHSIYDPYLRTTSRARESFYVFSKAADPKDVVALAARIRASRSVVLQDFNAQRA
jgi:SAM-dependent methyltransferase